MSYSTTNASNRLGPSPSQRRPQNWEALQALDDIVPTSPSISCGSIFLASLETSGEIPIILDSGVIVDFDCDERRRSKTCPVPGSSSPSRSFNRESKGTFGVPRTLLTRRSRDVFSESRHDNNRDSSLSAFGYQTPTVASQSSQFLSAQPEEGYYDRRSGSHSHFNLSAYMAPSVSQASLGRSFAGRVQPSTSQSLSVSPSPSVSTPTHRRFMTSHSPSIASSLSTIILSAGSAPGSPTVASSLITEAQAYASRYKQTSTLPTSDSRPAISGRVEFPRSVSPLDDKLSIHSPVLTTFSRPSSPAPPLEMNDVDTVTIVREGPMRLRTKSNVTAKSNESGRSGLSARTGQTAVSRSALSSHSAESSLRTCVSVDVPQSLPWLKNTLLRLWMDQEGFRLAQPVFRLSAYTPGSSTPNDEESELNDEATHGVAEFRPVKKYTFAFHHASLDPAPTLRKLTLQNDDSVDYISRQATLTVKSNGTYSVSGSETWDRGPLSPTFSTTHRTTEAVKLHWRFEYSVEDRYVEGTDKLRPGEKNVIPISFVCSPGLVHPAHGKKVKLMHVLKKGLVPKLASTKLEDAVLPATSPEASTFDLPPPISSAALEHRRVHSTTERVPVSSRQSTDSPVNEGQKVGYGLKRSRAMSFSPAPKPQLQVDAGLLDRHILPPDLVRKLLDNPEVAVVDKVRT